MTSLELSGEQMQEALEAHGLDRTTLESRFLKLITDHREGMLSSDICAVLGIIKMDPLLKQARDLGLGQLFHRVGSGSRTTWHLSQKALAPALAEDSVEGQLEVTKRLIQGWFTPPPPKKEKAIPEFPFTLVSPETDYTADDDGPPALKSFQPFESKMIHRSVMDANNPLHDITGPFLLTPRGVTGSGVGLQFSKIDGHPFKILGPSDPDQQKILEAYAAMTNRRDLGQTHFALLWNRGRVEVIQLKPLEDQKQLLNYSRALNFDDQKALRALSGKGIIGPFSSPDQLSESCEYSVLPETSKRYAALKGKTFSIRLSLDPKMHPFVQPRLPMPGDVLAFTGSALIPVPIKYLTCANKVRRLGR